MGNNQSSALTNRAPGALDTYISELGPELIHDQSLGTSRFLKTIRCRHKNGFVVVKLFLKSDPTHLDEKYLRRLKREKKSLQDIPNVYSYQFFVETEKAAYLVRQWASSNLYDRISTRPFLSEVEKKWIAFQILTGLRDASKKKVSHGDIKSENILVTSWTWVYITDFSSFKPTYLPLDNPSDFAYFYDTSGRRNCYIAPERFYATDKTNDVVKRSQTSDMIGSGRNDMTRKEGKVTEAMDVFSAGCVLAELFLEGAPMFTLSQLFKYRVGEYDINSHLASLDSQVQELIKSMIAIDPLSRPTFDQLLHTTRGTLFPESFYSLLHDFVMSVNDISSSSAVFSTASNNSTSTLPTNPPAPARSAVDDRASVSDAPRPESAPPLPDESDRRMSRLWSEFETVEPALKANAIERGSGIKIDYTPQYSSFKPLQSVLPVVASMSNQASRSLPTSDPPAEDGPALLILSLICSNLRNCSLASSKLRALDMLLVLSLYLTDEAKLDRLLPYVIELGHDEAPTVRMGALRSALQVLSLVKAITPFNSDIFPQFILPYLRYMTSDTETSVRSLAAQSIVPFSTLAVKFLEMGQALRAHGTLKMTGSQHYGGSQMELPYDARLEELQDSIEDQLSLLLVDQVSTVKRSLLLDIAPLCLFFGRQKTNEVLLSHMITYLNDRDWLLRYAFFDSIVDVAANLGGRNLEEYIFPLMTQALSDVEETNVAKVLSALTTLSELGLFQKMRLWELMSSTLPLLYHPNSWIKQGAALFIASAAKALPPTDVWCILYPSLRHFMRSDIQAVETPSILKALKSPLPRHIYDFAMDWAMKMGNSQFWRSQRKSTTTKNENPKDAAVAAARRGARGAIRITMKSEQDELQLNKLQQLGMSAPEEAKLVALRDYIAKAADASNSFRSRSRLESDSNLLQSTGHVELQKLGVVPQTIFLGSRAGPPETSRKVSDTYNLNLMRANSLEQSISTAPFEDLRRRLESINGSSASVAGVSTVAERTPMPPRVMTNVSDLPPSLSMRPGSPTESVISTTNSVSVRPRFNIGTVESAKAAPAIGQTRMNAVGLLEAPSRMSVDGDQSPSPMSRAHTVRNTRSPSGALQEDGDSTLNTYLDLIYTDLNNQVHNDFGPRTHDGPIRRRNAARQNFTIRDSKRRSVEASLIAHLNSHTAAVNGIAVSSDHLFFVTCSDDKTVKVWDSARLERNVTSKARHTYTQHHSRVKCVCMLERHHAFASAAEDGSIHVVRVHVNQSGSLPKYSKLQVVREHRLEKPGEYAKCMSHFTTDSASNLIYATNFSTIVMFDLLTMRTALVMENPKQYGPIVDFCLDRKKKWLVVATTSGGLSLWDLRFGLLLKTWSVGGPSGADNDPESASGLCIRSCCLHPSKGRGRWVMVAIDCPHAYNESDAVILIEVWDVEKATLVEWYMRRLSPQTSSSKPVAPALDIDSRPPSSSSYTPSSAEYSDTASAIAALVRARQQQRAQHPPSSTEAPTPSPFGDPSTLHPSPSPIFTCLVSGLDFGRDAHSARSFVDLALDTDRPSLGSGRAGFVLASGEDCSVRLLDLERFERSVVISEPSEKDIDRPVFTTHAINNNGSGGAGDKDKDKDRDKDKDKDKDTISSFPNTSSVSRENTPLVHVESPSPHSGPHAGAGQRASVVMAHQAGLLRAHQDCVRAVACLDAPFRGGIVSGDRAGVVKVWRVEGLADGGGASGGVGF